MTTKRSKFDRRKKAKLSAAPPPPEVSLDFLIAPGRKPDTADLILAKVRENTAVAEMTKPCLRCGKALSAKDFTLDEWRKVRPTCLACAATPLRKTPQWVKAADVLPLPVKPLTGLTAFRKRLADEATAVAKAEQDAEHTYRMHADYGLTPDEI